MIEINNLTSILIDKKFLKKIAEIVLKNEKQKEKRLSIALVGQKEIKKINRKYRGKDRITDVLSFPGNKKEGLGEIIICLEKVKKNAKRFDSFFKKELARILIHGILHLLGYNHERSEIGARKMVKKEEYYLLLAEL